MRGDVEQPAASGLGDRLEVPAPDFLGATSRVPDAVVVHVDGALAQEVHRADDVVEVAGVEQVGRAILGAGNEVRLDPEPEIGLFAHERAVLVDVVVRVGFPEGVTPDAERLGEAVDVFGDTQLGDAAFIGHLAVALDVRLRVVRGGFRVAAVGS